jgi:hypothetical protein
MGFRSMLRWSFSPCKHEGNLDASMEQSYMPAWSEPQCQHRESVHASIDCAHIYIDKKPAAPYFGKSALVSGCIIVLNPHGGHHARHSLPR